MYDEAWKEMWLEDRETKRALDSSEVFCNYERAELQREKLREVNAQNQKIDEEVMIYEDLEKFQSLVNSDTKLRAKFAAAKKALHDNPGLKDKVDPNFIRGLMLLDLGEL